MRGQLLAAPPPATVLRDSTRIQPDKNDVFERTRLQQALETLQFRGYYSRHLTVSR